MLFRSYNQGYLGLFGSDFRMSVLTSTIDNADTSILSNETTSFMYKKFTSFQSTLPIALTVDFYGNALKPGSIISNQFSSGGKNYVVTDRVYGVTNTVGNLYKLEKTLSTTTLNYSIVGTVDYANGLVNIGTTQYDYTPSGGLRIFASPVNQDIYTNKNNIIEIDVAAGLSITVVSG